MVAGLLSMMVVNLVKWVSDSSSNDFGFDMKFRISLLCLLLCKKV